MIKYQTSIATVLIFLTIPLFKVIAQERSFAGPESTLPYDDLSEIRNTEGLIFQHYEADELEMADVSASYFQFQPMETYVIRPEEAEIQKMDSNVYRNLSESLQASYNIADFKLLPEIYLQTGSGPYEQSQYRIGFENNQSMEYVYSTKHFEGGIKFFLFSVNSLQDNVLRKPVHIEIVSNDIGSISPVSAEIDHISIPSTEVSLLGDNIADSAQVKIITDSRPDGYETYVRVRPALELRSLREELQGLGIQKVPITAFVLGSTSSDSLEVSITAEKGTVTPNTFYVHYNSPTTFELRSEGTGDITLTAYASITSNELTVKYIFPWIFILMATIGGMLGGLVKYISNKDKYKPIISIVEGVFLGFFGAIAYYALGITLVQIEVVDIFNEFSVLGFSALVAYFGISPLDKLLALLKRE